jgi:hypothetical protein
MKRTGIFLTTHGDDSRRLLCKAVLPLAQVRGRVLDGPGMVAWGRAAGAADPTYFNCHSQLSFGLQHTGLYAESLQEMKAAMVSDAWEMLPIRARRIALLEQVVNGNQDGEKAALTELLTDKRGAAFRYWQEMEIPRPAKSCAQCFWEGDNKSARCKTVCYCSRDCQVDITKWELFYTYAAVETRATRGRHSRCTCLFPVFLVFVASWYIARFVYSHHFLLFIYLTTLESPLPRTQIRTPASQQRAR